VHIFFSALYPQMSTVNSYKWESPAATTIPICSPTLGTSLINMITTNSMCTYCLYRVSALLTMHILFWVCLILLLMPGALYALRFLFQCYNQQMCTNKGLHFILLLFKTHDKGIPKTYLQKNTSACTSVLKGSRSIQLSFHFTG
jgi:hypothetical protein